MNESIPPRPASGTDNTPVYQVLARKYRPRNFHELIGQEAMVRVLTSAFAHDRIAHAFILTGVRGVGKTTTARIIAKGLNCLRDDKPTIEPCGECEACVAIAEGRHVDVLEMDAASNTGVDNIREIIDSVRYRAASARYKVYIVDEVHMLSTSAFNALLKTLEEPPPHVKFIFATTEIRKVPVTVLSRCQRFDLRRIEPEAMMAHLRRVADLEGVAVEDEALALITRAAEGAVRDALSLLDQAIAQGQGSEGPIGAAEVRAMLGLADRARVIDLFEAIMKGDAAGALDELARQYADGADPAVVLRDLAELTHWISVLKVSKEAAADPTISPEELARGRVLAEGLSMRALTRAWQMLLKAIEELPLAPTPMMAAEMAVIRLTHVADLPPPEELVRRLTTEGVSASVTRDRTAGPPSGVEGRATPDAAPAENRSTDHGAGGARLMAVGGTGEAAPAGAPRAEHAAAAELARWARFEEVLALLAEARELRLLHDVERFLRLIRFRPGLIEFAPAPGAPADLAGRLAGRLQALTGARWQVVVSDGEGAPTVAERRAAERAAAAERVAAHPLVKAALEAFPGAEIRAIRPLDAGSDAGDTYLEAAPEDEDEAADWAALIENPFEEEL